MMGILDSISAPVISYTNPTRSVAMTSMPVCMAVWGVAAHWTFTQRSASADVVPTVFLGEGLSERISTKEPDSFDDEMDVWEGRSGSLRHATR